MLLEDLDLTLSSMVEDLDSGSTGLGLGLIGSDLEVSDSTGLGLGSTGLDLEDSDIRTTGMDLTALDLEDSDTLIMAASEAAVVSLMTASLLTGLEDLGYGGVLWLPVLCAVDLMFLIAVISPVQVLGVPREVG